MANIIDGKKIASDMREELRNRVSELKEKKGIVPKLSVVLIGEDSASAVYVRHKEKACEAAGMLSDTHRFSYYIEENKVLALIESLNHQKDVHGILDQLPLPKQLDTQKIIRAITVEKLTLIHIS